MEYNHNFSAHPLVYQNKIQDMIGSFAYIGVTFFFLTSSFGLKYGVENKENYIKNFWKERIPKILIPVLTINCLSVFVNFLSNKYNILGILNINRWVLLLLLFYLIFYIVNLIYKENNNKYIKDLTIILLIIVCSLIDKFTPLKITFIWPTECLGFIYGILLYDFFDVYKNWMEKNWLYKTILILVGALLFGVVYLKYKTIFFIGDYCLKIVLCVIITMLLMQIIVKFKIGNKFSYFLGKISYEIYLLHNTVFAILNLFCINYNSGVYIFISLLLTIVLSYIFWKINNKIIKLIAKKD